MVATLTQTTGSVAHISKYFSYLDYHNLGFEPSNVGKLTERIMVKGKCGGRLGVPRTRDRAADSGDRIPTTVVPEVVVVAVPERQMRSRWAPQHLSQRAKDARRVESVLPPTGGTSDACGLKTFNRRLDARPPTLERLGGQFEGGEAGIGGSFVVVESVIDRPRPRRSPGVPPDPHGHLWKPHLGDAMRLRPRTLVRRRGLPTSNRSPRGAYPIRTEAHGFEFRGRW